MTDTREAGWHVVTIIALTAGFTALAAAALSGAALLVAEAALLAVALPTGYGTVRWWLPGGDVRPTGRHRKPSPACIGWRVRNNGGHAYTFTERHGEHVWDDTGWFPLADDDATDTDVLPAVDDREEAYR